MPRREASKWKTLGNRSKIAFCAIIWNVFLFTYIADLLFVYLRVFFQLYNIDVVTSSVQNFREHPAYNCIHKYKHIIDGVDLYASFNNSFAFQLWPKTPGTTYQSEFRSRWVVSSHTTMPDGT